MKILDSIIALLKKLILPTMTQEEVKDRLEKLAAAHPEKLNWRTSIVDLLKLLDMDSGLQARKDLAVELGYTGPLDGSAEMNTWLHQEVLKEVAKHDIKLPV